MSEINQALVELAQAQDARTRRICREEIAKYAEAQAIEAQRAATVKQGAVEDESAVGEAGTP